MTASVNKRSQLHPHYVDLRDLARSKGEEMVRAFAASQQAYTSGKRALAKELSKKGHFHKSEMERLNLEASEWAFHNCNAGNPPGEVDLHGLHVKEAIEYTDRAIQEARQRGEGEIRLIVAGSAKLKPAIKSLMQK
ncbi:hypothetical protein K488DRAFT_68093 [Vararia minispora EC-137]|uniref:Uncharacterized protein n=1 Tax=Vararia minispora EC-137 TaxID=1314806 RepID=A0ACB8QWR0_9AGAM|nr:hypothetical protein K488DRAFT_68093 [Vararia minispora EC-137]